MPNSLGTYILWGYSIRTEAVQRCSARQQTPQAFAEPLFWSFRRNKCNDRVH